MDENHQNVRVGINGLGVMGRIVYRLLSREKGMDVVMVNDLTPKEDLEYLLRNDSVHGRDKDLSLEEVKVTSEEDHTKLDWKRLGVDIVVDATPHLKSYRDLSKHLQSGSEYVVRTSPLKGKLDETQTIVFGVNDNELDVEKYNVVGMASCTTNCLAPLVGVLLDYCDKTDNQIEDLDFVTVHAETSDQLTRDGYHPDSPRGRGRNIIETSTGASSQITLLFPELEGKIFGSCYRVPVSDGSHLELRVRTRDGIDIEEVNKFFAEAAGSESLNGVLSYETDALVSGDCINDAHTCLYLENAAEQINDKKIKLGALYDNEFGYSSKIVGLVRKIKEEKFDPITKQFRKYASEMTVECEAWDPDDDDNDCDSDPNIGLSFKDVKSVFTNLEKELDWQCTEFSDNKFEVRTTNAIYQFVYRGERQRASLYDGLGHVIDLGSEVEREKHLANRNLIQKKFSTKYMDEVALHNIYDNDISPDDHD